MTEITDRGGLQQLPQLYEKIPWISVSLSGYIQFTFWSFVLPGCQEEFCSRVYFLDITQRQSSLKKFNTLFVEIYLTELTTAENW